MLQKLQLSLLILFALHLSACSMGANPSANSRAPERPTQDHFAPLFNHVWRVSDPAHTWAPGSIYIFLPNGTLLETSCVETYRVALWSIDKAQPDVLRVTEDQQQVFSVTLGESTASTMHLHQTLLRSKETRELTLTSIGKEFVCPDLPK
jgi:hypothetical protein